MFQELSEKYYELKVKKLVKLTSTSSIRVVQNAIYEFEYLYLPKCLENGNILDLYLQCKEYEYKRLFRRNENEISNILELEDFEKQCEKQCDFFKNMLYKLSLNKILRNSFFEEEIMCIFIDLANAEIRCDHGPFSDYAFESKLFPILNELIAIPKCKETLIQNIDFQQYGELILHVKDYDYCGNPPDKKYVMFFKECGYVPCQSVNEVATILLEREFRANQPYTDLLTSCGFNLQTENCKKYALKFSKIEDANLRKEYLLKLSCCSMENKTAEFFLDLIEYENKYKLAFRSFSLQIPNYCLGWNIANRPDAKELVLDLFEISSKFDRSIIGGLTELFFEFMGHSEVTATDIKTILTLMENRIDASLLNYDTIKVMLCFLKDCSTNYIVKFIELFDSFIEMCSIISSLISKYDIYYREAILKVIYNFLNNNITDITAEKLKRSVKNFNMIVDISYSIASRSGIKEEIILKIIYKYFENNITDMTVEKLKHYGENFNAIADIISDYDNLDLKKYAFEFYLNNIDVMSVSDFKIFDTILKRVRFSNASELVNFKDTICKQLLTQKDPLKKYEQLEDVFLKNNLPTVGKIFSVFKILHTDYNQYDFSSSSAMSPTLKNRPNHLKENMWGEENLWRDIIIFADLVKASLGSNNRSMKKYLESIEEGNRLFLQISSENFLYDHLNEEQKKTLSIYVNHLNTLYNNTLKGKSANNVLSNDTFKDLKHLFFLFSLKKDSIADLPNRIIKMYFYFAGFKTFDEVKEYMNKKVSLADKRNREFSAHDLVLNVGDFIKGIGDVDYLETILQNGSVSKEFLGASASQDSTPLDTDVSMILEDGSLANKINNSLSSRFGPIYFVLKNDNRFYITRSHDSEKERNGVLTKLEAFSTGGGEHYGIRTGFASSEINAIMMKEYDQRVGLEIAINGFYIPVFDFEGKIVFTPKDYDHLRSKMSGLSYYGENNYFLSKEIGLIEVNSILEEQEKENPTIESYRNIIYEEVAKVLQKYGLTLRKSISNDLSNGVVELIDTGSTSRSTYVPGDIDFDFTMRLDREILLNDRKLANLKNDLLQVFHQKDDKDVYDGNFRLKEAYVEGIPNSLKIDINFLQKTDKVTYTTDLVIQDYLNTIKKQDEDKYKQVVGNIVIAKKIFKEAGCYKAHRSDSTQGGLGGVGIENFILQNGGSFITAAKNFLEVAEGKSFEEFKKEYCIWNFGDNFLAESRGKYPHNNFVADNMSIVGYNKMKNVLQKYLKKHEKTSQLFFYEREEIESSMVR